MSHSVEFEAFEQFVQGSLPALTRTAWALTGDAHLAQDLVQETHIRVARHWNRIGVDGENVVPYARKVLYRLFLDSRRWRSRRPEHVTDSTPSSATADGTEQVVIRMTVASALTQLTPRQRAVVVLRYLEDRSEDEVAEILDEKVPTVHALARRALKELRVRYPELELR